MTDSTGRNYVLPLGQIGPPLDDRPLEDALQAMVVGVTGLPGKLVRPLWQPDPPPSPPAETDWAAVGVTQETPDVFAYVEHDPNGAGGVGADIQQRHEDVLVQVTFYGPNSQGYAKRLVMGLGIAQNRELLGTVGIKIKEVGPPMNAPELVNTQFIRRVDVQVHCRRNVTLAYPIRTIDGVVIAPVLTIEPLPTPSPPATPSGIANPRHFYVQR